jgi:hypothetical protein
MAMHRMVPRGLCALAALVLWVGCATGAPGNAVGLRHSDGVPPPSTEKARPRERSFEPVLADGERRGWRRFFAEKRDAWQALQEAAGLEAEARHAEGEALEEEDARRLWRALAHVPVTLVGYGPRLTLAYLLREALLGGEDVEYAQLLHRLERFHFLVVMRPDGYLSTAISGKPLQRMGEVRLEEGRLMAGPYEVGAFYFSNAGVFYPVDARLQQSDWRPLGELGLRKDWLNTALDGAGDALLETAKGIGHTVAHPIRTVEALVQLPSAVSALIRASPEYFARYRTLPRDEQIREAARLSTHLLMMCGSAAGATTRVTTQGARLPVLTLSADGALAVEAVAVPVGTLATTVGTGTGAVYVLMAQRGRSGGDSNRPAPPGEPGQWTSKKPTTKSDSALRYQKQITGRPASQVYVIDDVEFDGFSNGVLLEAKGPNYDSFFSADGRPMPWYQQSGKFQELIDQALSQSRVAGRLGLPLHWHVADAEVATFLSRIFGGRTELQSIVVIHTLPVP